MADELYGCEFCKLNNPHTKCRCSILSEEPCSWCDWWTSHDLCPEVTEDDGE